MKGMNRLFLFLLFSFTGYFLIGHIFERSHFWLELSAFALCFIAYFIFNLKFKESVMILFFAGLFFRLIFMWGEPKLSDDYYRFIWDGKIVGVGENPYEKLPSESKPQNGLQQNMHNDLLFRMNSPYYYSVYPPIQQLFFVPTGFTESIPMALLVLRLEILIGEILLFIFLIKSVQSQFISLVSVSWIWLNPLWIIEVNGNLHFEGLDDDNHCHWNLLFIQTKILVCLCVYGVVGFFKNDSYYCCSSSQKMVWI
jgi:alpha-1,6-mannosyltransferase